MADEDDGYGELVLLGFDTVKEQWACKHLPKREGGTAPVHMGEHFKS